ncbi:hypothetical protein FKM82_017889 [Ascaphus truei]
MLDLHFSSISSINHLSFFFLQYYMSLLVCDYFFFEGSLSAMRFVTAVQMSHPEFLEQVSRELWLRIWSEDKDITEPDSLLEAARKAGMALDQVEKLLGMISSPEVKSKLRETTEEALEYGTFGMPTMVAHIDGKPQLYFGSDRIEVLAHQLGEKWLGPVPPQKSRL